MIKRFFAFLIDILLLTGSVFLLRYFIGNQIVVLSLFGIFVQVAYFCFLPFALNFRTVGQLFFRLKLVHINAKILDARDLIKRYCLLILPFNFVQLMYFLPHPFDQLKLVIFSYIFTTFTPILFGRELLIYDFLSKTTVIDSKKELEPQKTPEAQFDLKRYLIVFAVILALVIFGKLLKV